MRTRVPVFDNIKFFLIILVVFGHLKRIGCFIPWSIYKIIYSFHMPLFILMSGYFTSKNKDTQKFWRSNLNLALLFVIFSAITSCVNVFVYHRPAFRSIFIPHFALWYILCMIYWRLIIHYTPEKVLKSPWFMIGALSVSVLPNIFPLNYCAFSRCLTFFPYFLLGWLCRQYQWIDKLNNLKLGHRNTIIIGSIICCIIAIKIPSGIFWGNTPLDLPLIKILVFKLIACVIALINALTVYIVMPKTKGIKEGQYTLFYYLFHTILLYPCLDMIMRYAPHNMITSVVALACIMIILYLLRKVPILNKLINIGK